jgi:Yip1 domain
MSPQERAWWRRLPLVLVRPREVFAALRSTDDADIAARQEPILLLILLAGMGAALVTPAWQHLRDDDPSMGGLVIAVLTFVGGGLYGAAAYFLLGGALHLGARGMGSAAVFRLSRHVLAFASVPLALSLFVLAPVIAVLYGRDWFFAGGPESAGADAVTALGLAFVLWALGLVVVGLRVTLALPWRGVVGALLLGGVLVAAFAVLPSSL